MRQPSPFFQELLADAGGYNQYGQPIFRFAWSESEFGRISDGRCYRDFRICGDPCWLLMKWEPAEFWGNREEWELNNRERYGLLTAGTYPSNGKYRSLRKLLRAQVVDGVLSYVPIELSTPVVTQILPLLKGFLDLSNEARAKLIADREVAEKEQNSQRFIKSREDYRGAASSKEVQDRVASLERYMGDKAWQRRVLNQTSSGRRRRN